MFNNSKLLLLGIARYYLYLIFSSFASIFFSLSFFPSTSLTFSSPFTLPRFSFTIVLAGTLTDITKTIIHEGAYGNAGESTICLRTLGAAQLRL